MQIWLSRIGAFQGELDYCARFLRTYNPQESSTSVWEP